VARILGSKVEVACERYDSQPWPSENPPEIVISTLPPKVRFEPEMLDALMRAHVLMDANYGSRSTLHHQPEREIVTGDAMLEEQARAAFDFWPAHVEGVAPERG
jgi:shikimate 5-dehydrogenase